MGIDIDENDISSSSAHMEIGDLDSLTKDQKKRLCRWMARSMEKAYRRGVQQALYMRDTDQIDEWIMDDIHSYRYAKSLDLSIGLDGFTTTSIERLHIEEPMMTVLGLD